MSINFVFEWHIHSIVITGIITRRNSDGRMHSGEHSLAIPCAYRGRSAVMCSFDVAVAAY